MEKNNVLLFGNGLNRISNGDSWSKILNDVSNSPILSSLPYPLQYDFILFDNKNALETQALSGRQSKLKEKIKESISKFGSNEVYAKICTMPFDAYITTNYDMALDAALEGENFEYDKKLSNYQEKYYNIRRCRVYCNNEEKKYIYPIHGDINSPNSIVMGYNHYCGTLGKIDRYIKGREYDLPKMEERLENGELKIKYWIDHFFFSDVYIIGFGFDYSEIELWWILDRRRRLMLQNKSLISNKITFYDIVDGDPRNKQDDKLSEKEKKKKDKYELLEKMGVNCEIIVKKNDYKSGYINILEKVDSDIEQKK